MRGGDWGGVMRKEHFTFRKCFVYIWNLKDDACEKIMWIQEYHEITLPKHDNVKYKTSLMNITPQSLGNL